MLSKGPSSGCLLVWNDEASEIFEFDYFGRIDFREITGCEGRFTRGHKKKEPPFQTELVVQVLLDSNDIRLSVKSRIT